MSQHAKHVARHRGAPKTHGVVEAPRKALRTTLLLSSVAVAATGVTVGGGLLTSSPAAVSSATDVSTPLTAPPTTPLDTSAPVASQTTAPDRPPVLSRSSDRRDTTDPVKQAALSATVGSAVSGSQHLSDSAPKDIAMALLGDYGWDQSQFGCLDSLWTRESGWNPRAANPTSSAYGIPQALPGSKMSTVGSDWATNPVTQIKWGLGYIQERYGSPCGAWSHSEATGFY